jgi:hypothetical protein
MMTQLEIMVIFISACITPQVIEIEFSSLITNQKLQIEFHVKDTKA